MAATVRFSRVVEVCGAPHVHTLWVEPEKDPELKRAQAADRVMTVHRAPGKTEFATVGFEQTEEKAEQYLIFPKPLRRFEGARVVGVKFDLIEQPKLAAVDADVWAASAASRPAKKKAPLPPPIPFPTPAREEPARRADLASRSDAPPAPRQPPKAAKRAASRPAPTGPSGRQKQSPSRAMPLAREVRAALKELQRGKTIAAYQRLERALEDSENR